MSGIVVVDAANVVGSRPDGWWRDRAGAARRLHERLVSADIGTVVLVLEGAARAGVAEDASNERNEGNGVRVVHAPASGDDAVVEVVGELTDVTVVTSDRELRRRVEALGARTVGPSWLLEQLPD